MILDTPMTQIHTYICTGDLHQYAYYEENLTLNKLETVRRLVLNTINIL